MGSVFNISWGEFLVLVVAALFILGPERLPGAAAWLGRTVRTVRTYAGGIQEQLRTELGPDFDDLRKPLAQLRGLRDFDPKRAITQHLLDATGGYGPREDLRLDRAGTNDVKPHGFPPHTSPTQRRPLDAGERPPSTPTPPESPP
jgi:sec-independent protein translocase protein TatB